MTVPQSEPYLAGMLAELRCSISLDDAINTQVAVAVLWQRNGEGLNETVRVRTLPPRPVRGSSYDALLQFSTLSSITDSGNYMCISTVFPTENANYITNSTEMTSFSFSVTGNPLLATYPYVFSLCVCNYINLLAVFTTDPIVTATVSPLVYSGKDIPPFNAFNLACTATKSSSIIPALQLSWYHDGLQLDGTVSDVTILQEVRSGMEKSSTLSIASARVMNSGLYTCNVVVSIPESQDVSADHTANVTITGIIYSHSVH